MTQAAPRLRGGAGASPWILTPAPNPNAVLRLFCLPYAGADTWIFHDWQRALPDFIEVCAIRLPGRGSRMADEPHTHLDALVAAIADGIGDALDLPFVIFGHSMGALVGFELARHLRRTLGRQPLMLCVGGCRAPQNVYFRPPISKLGPYVLLEVLRARYGASMDDLAANDDLLQLTMPVMRADFAMCESYEYCDDDRLDCPIVVYRGSADGTLGAADADAWRTQTKDIFRHHEIRGDHFFPVGAKDALLTVLAQDLEWSVS